MSTAQTILIWTLPTLIGAFLLAEAFWRFVVTPMSRKLFRTRRAAPAPLPDNLADTAESVEIDSHGSRMRAWLVRPSQGEPGALTVLLHGWAQEGGRMAGFAEYLVERGIACLLLDMRGHGRSDRYPDYNALKMLQDIESVRKWLDDRPDLSSLPAALLGFSFGGLGSMVSLCRNPRWESAVSVGAPSSPLRGTYFYLEKQGLPARLLCKLMVPAIRREFGVHPDELDAARCLPTVGKPVMVIHGTVDPVVPLSDAERMAGSVPEEYRSTLWVEGAGHGDILQNSRALRAAAEFLAGHLLKQ